MSSCLRLVLVAWLALALPVQGWAAAAMRHCASTTPSSAAHAHRGSQATAATPMHGGGHEPAAAHHGSHAGDGGPGLAAAGHDGTGVAPAAGHGHGHGHGQGVAGADDAPRDASASGGNSSCSACAACCAGAPLPATVTRLVAPEPAVESPTVAVLAPVSFIVDGPERPPRFRAG